MIGKLTSPTVLTAVGVTLAALWAINNVAALRPVKTAIGV